MTSMIQTESAGPDWAALAARMDGDLVAPGDSSWNEARRAWNLAVDQRPAAVALVETAGDVIDVVSFASDNGLRVAPQGTGHNARPLGPLDDTILLKTERMRCVTVDASARTARVEAGVLWAEATAEASRHGLTALAGSSPDVGVVGYTVGGGVSWLARKHGLAANSVTVVELVTADGRLVRADRDTEPDLFWAVRGGGGSFGVVTALEFRLYPLTHVYGGVLFFPHERAAEVLHAWREWTVDAPDEITSVGRLMQFPPIPDIPDPLRGKAFVLVEAVYAGGEERGAELIAPLRALGPVMDTFATMPTSGLQQLHMDPEHPVPGTADGLLLGELPREAVDALLEVAGPGSGSPLFSVEVRQLGGAVGRPSAEHGALASIDAKYAVFAVGIGADPQMQAAGERYVAQTLRALAPWDAGRSYLNFTESAGHGGGHWSEAAYRRLGRIKAQVDPTDVIRANHPVRPAQP
jgi:UDP-N-acetylenolpyruvoylglucosamine reductase